MKSKFDVYLRDRDGAILRIGVKHEGREAADVGLDVWAAYGADEYTLEAVMIGEVVLETPEWIYNRLKRQQEAAYQQQTAR